jgi:ATP-binding cassette subfamily G (WHITE) protein 1
MYTVSAYFFGKIISELPSCIIAPFLHSVIVYYGVGLNDNTVWKFPIHYLIEFLSYMSGLAYTLIISVGFSDKKLAVSLIPALLAPFMLLSGFFVNSNRTPFWLMPFNYVSFYRYSFQAMMINEYSDQLLECQEIPPNHMGRCDPLGDFNSPEGLWESLAYLTVLIIACMLVSLWIMKILSHRAF